MAVLKPEDLRRLIETGQQPVLTAAMAAAAAEASSGYQPANLDRASPEAREAFEQQLFRWCTNRSWT